MRRSGMRSRDTPGGSPPPTAGRQSALTRQSSCERTRAWPASFESSGGRYAGPRASRSARGPMPVRVSCERVRSVPLWVLTPCPPLPSGEGELSASSEDLPQDGFEVFSAQVFIAYSNNSMARSYQELGTCAVVGLLSPSARASANRCAGVRRRSGSISRECRQGCMPTQPEFRDARRKHARPELSLRPPSPQGRGGQGVRTRREVAAQRTNSAPQARRLYLAQIVVQPREGICSIVADSSAQSPR